MAGVVIALADKAKEIVQACGSTVISAMRHTKVAGTNIWSCHASGHAVDIQKNPSCIYSHLSGWRGGYSTDYSRVNHVHVSLGCREDGVRFVHGGGRGKRHAQHRYVRHANR